MMHAKFKANLAFIIRERGLILSGEIIEGTIKEGMQLQIPHWPEILKIKSVEFLCRLDRKPEIGLVFPYKKSSVSDWENLTLTDQTLEIHD